jgi:hypothetical protein
MLFGVISIPDPAGCYHHNVSGYNSHVVEVYGVIGGYEGNKIIWNIPASVKCTKQDDRGKCYI